MRRNSQLFFLCVLILAITGCLTVTYQIYDYKPFSTEKDGIKIKGMLRWSSYVKNDTVWCVSPYDMSVSIVTRDSVKVDNIKLSAKNSSKVVIEIGDEKIRDIESSTKQVPNTKYYLLKSIEIEHDDLILDVKFDNLTDGYRDSVSLNIEKEFKEYKTNKIMEYIKAR